ncbi:uncharacterized protein MAM_00828 [Metarhizium album ARSEF 1941]|uniref:Uncharacterized protein n=1 Tax=Metarhizium album (strain ARSEF 1941) TaxID=1081103 RepID=A0A0B2WZY8_METAS|nr:uncharacterized protein MAM_00828 [Metarhizium album ARSEF 1941]KHO01827.1 hypothetical protein MAM_00828 [Metarhizium album ARSEF 1941]
MDPVEDVVAAAMGFSSFGAQDHPQKKRRCNLAVDTVTPAAQPFPGPRATPAESDSTPSGTHDSTSKGDSEAQANADEINLDDEEEDHHETIPPKPSAETLSQAHTSRHGLPARPAPGAGSVGPSRRFPTGRHGVSQAGDSRAWYEGYYDSASNENPWDRLETSMGLESTGAWIPRQVHPEPSV